MVKFYYDKENDVILHSLNAKECLQLVELVPNTTEAAVEKHIPMVTALEHGTEIQVGSTLHPSLEEHYIEWIYVELKKGGLEIPFAWNEEPKVVIPFAKEEIVAVYSYCNLHGLWKLEDLS